MTEKLRIGYIPLVDAAALLVAVDQGFTAAERLNVELVREVSWSNVRDKLNIGLFDAAHLLSPVAIASSLGIGHVRVPLVVPFNLGVNGNAITVSPRLFTLLSHAADGDLTDPKVSSRALARVIAERKARTDEPLTFGMTFPFSHHNYQLRYWMAAGGVDPDDDVRMVVLPPPYMVDSLASGHVDGFCVGAPWNSAAVDCGVGHILHFGCEIMARVSEKVLAVRERWARDNPDALAALVRALVRAAEFINRADNRASVANIIAQRIGTTPDLVVRTLTGVLKTKPDGAIRQNDSYIVIGRDGADRPDPVQAAWAYAQIVRWGQAPLSEELRATAQNVFRPDLYDSALGGAVTHDHGGPRDGIGAFIGPDFNVDDIAGYVSAWRTRRAQRPRLSVVR
jgi:ABC-type nitrate/sulfonate/bicarbonate transport system substrate-binding protein